MHVTELVIDGVPHVAVGERKHYQAVYYRHSPGRQLNNMRWPAMAAWLPVTVQEIREMDEAEVVRRYGKELPRPRGVRPPEEPPAIQER